jgi:diaminohydroxyphosphoribosylaminopyrimidine deaminase/5-amino-6-(5-phosphoribosylamino)uracil reductase
MTHREQVRMTDRIPGMNQVGPKVVHGSSGVTRELPPPYSQAGRFPSDRVFPVSVDDEKWMRDALAEARRGVGRTSPNPPVGAVVVAGGRVAGRGWHRRAGQPHAEREALADAVRAAGTGSLCESTVYVTLEPCSTTGRTPPCTDALIEAGCRRVVWGSTDPNPRHAGRAEQLLGEAGIEVRTGVLADECDELIRGFTMVQQNGRPWVIVKSAMSLDGRLTRPPGEGQWLTGKEARHEVQRIRSEVDAILTSGETLRRDDPALTIRVPEFLEGRDQPLRVVLTRDPASLPAEAQVFQDEWKERTLVRGGDLGEILRDLAEHHGCRTVMLEAGGRLAGEFVDHGLADEMILFLAPMVTGGDVPALGGTGEAGPWNLRNVTFRQFGDDVMMRGMR